MIYFYFHSKILFVYEFTQNMEEIELGRYITGDGNTHIYRCENFKSCHNICCECKMYINVHTNLISVETGSVLQFC
jgi:hypothetical protein